MNGLRTVLLHRGTRGYGFNLAEEYPCYLSAVHEGGVAWKAGLRTGDRLAAVGSMDVTRTSHKDIAKMMADSGSLLQLTVFSSSINDRSNSNQRRAEMSESSSDCDSDNEIWRRKKCDLAQRFQQKLPRRSRYKNLITPISEALVDEAASANGILRRNVKSIDEFEEPNGFEDNTNEKVRFKGDIRVHLATVHRRNSPPETKRATRRPLSSLQTDDSRSTGQDTARNSRSPAKIIKKCIGGRKSIGNRSASAPDYRRTFFRNNTDQDCNTELSTAANIGIDDAQSSSDDEDKEGDESNNEDDDDDEDLIKRSVVVYIGAIPVSNAGKSRKNILKSALQSLRAQRVRAHTVLLEIFTNQIVITNSKGVMTNRFCADCISYATSCAENKQYFGLITDMNNRSSRTTTTTTDETDESDCMVCHVFAVDPQLHLHSFHYHYARKFGIHCVRDPQTNFCQEFPYSSNSILHAIGYVYRNYRSNISSSYNSPASVKGLTVNGVTAYVSSNSDSGIGNGKDDFRPCIASRPPPAYSTISNRMMSKLDNVEQGPLSQDIAINGSNNAEVEKKKTKAVRFEDFTQTIIPDGISQTTPTKTTKMAENIKDLLDTTNIPVLAISPKELDKRFNSKLPNYVSCSVTDVHHLTNKVQSEVLKSTTVNNSQTGSGQSTVDSSSEIGGILKRKLCGSVEHLAASTNKAKPDNYAGSSSSLFTFGSLQHQQVTVEPNPTKHGSLLRDRINRRFNRNVGGEQSSTGACGKRTLSIRMKQATKERLEKWSVDFDRLLRDPAGIHAFSEFLRTQYCQENINFWIACENYKLADDTSRMQMAMELYRNYFASSCTEPVNVDSLARQAIQEAVETETFTATTFNAAQYQIFHLMKYDCYPRFLKSDEYQRCWEMGEKGQHLPEMKEPFLSNADSATGSTSSLSSKLFGNAGGEEQKKTAASSRKSLLPWKNKGVNLIGRNKTKKEDDPSTMHAQQPSTSDATQSQRSVGLSSVGSKRKQAWRHTKQLSTPADTAHAVRKPSGSVEGSQLFPLHPRPNSGLSVSRPPDVVPQPDPPSSPSPGPRPRNASHLQLQSKTAPASPSLSRVVELSPDSCKYTCTLILPSREELRTAVNEDLTVRRWLHDIANKYGLNAAATDIIDVETDEPVDLSTNAVHALAGKTLRVEGGVLFKVDLPCPNNVGHTSETVQRKLVAVKARADSAAGQVLRPILNKYGLQLDSVMVCVAGTNEVVPNHSPISLANNKKLMVLTQSEFEEWVHRDQDAAGLFNNRSSPSRSALSPSFEDIVGAKYFQELPSHKGLGIAELPPEIEGSKLGRHQQQQSNGSNKQGGGGMLKFVKRGAADAPSTTTKFVGQQTKSLRLSSHPNHSANQHQEAPARKSVLSRQELLEMAKEEKKLAELLNRAQASSFDDQRGASVKNFELPDFLKEPIPSTNGANSCTNAQLSSMDDNFITSPSSNESPKRDKELCHSRPTDLVHRKLCGGSPAGSNICDEELFESQKEDIVGEGDKTDSRIPTHEEAEALFSIGSKGIVDFNDPMMTERRRLSDFGLSSRTSFDHTITSATINKRVSAASVMNFRVPPPPYQRPPPTILNEPRTKLSPPVSTQQRKDSGTSLGHVATEILDQDQKRKGLYVHHQDEDWQIDYV